MKTLSIQETLLINRLDFHFSQQLAILIKNTDDTLAISEVNSGNWG